MTFSSFKKLEKFYFFPYIYICWLDGCIGFNASLTAKVMPWGSVTHMCFLAFSHQHSHSISFQSHQLLFSHASAEVRGKNMPERKVASTADRTRNHQVMSLACSPLSHPGGTHFYTNPLASHALILTWTYCPNSGHLERCLFTKYK